MATGGKKKKAASPRKSGPRSGGGAPKTRPGPTSAPSAVSRFGGPLAILVIMGLLAVIAIMASHYTRDRGSKPVPDKPHEQLERQDDDTEIRSLGVDDADDMPGLVAVEEGSQKDDTSGARDDAQSREVKVYLLRLDEKTEKINLVPLNRRVPVAQPIEAALRELIKGPSATEKKRGYLSAVPRELKLRGIALNGKTAVLDFNTVIEQDAAGSILMSRIDQIVYTATQFPEVTGVMIRVNGATRASLGSDGLSISGPLRRRAP